jgi:protein phosphatase PTC6
MVSLRLLLEWCHVTIDYVGNEWACIVLVSDGISSILSDQEIVDLARGAPDPKTAADRILGFSQDLGGDDNATAIVIPLPGWGKVEGHDQTKEFREYRKDQARKYYF